ncbi:MAG: DUF349 domain-containing protein, partial [bacterium]|nr:DUF349 domain-containing protein [bacterium]
IDEAFARKSSEREKASTALNAHDQRVLEASQAVDAASASGDAQQIRTAMAALEAALRGQAEAAAEPARGGSNAVATPAEAGATDVKAEEPLMAPAADGSAPADAEGEVSAAEAPAPAKPAAPPKKIVAVRGDDRPGMKKTEPAGRDDRRGAPGRDSRDARGGFGGRGDGRDARDGRGGERFDREPRGPRLGDAAFRAQRQAIEHAEAALRKLAAQAHGEVLTQLLTAWEQRDASQLPTAQALGSRVNAATRSAWSQSLNGGAPAAVPADALLRLEMAAEVPTPAELLDARRMLQLQLLTRRHEAAPADTWAQDVSRVLAGDFDAGAARRLQNALKVLLKR